MKLSKQFVIALMLVCLPVSVSAKTCSEWFQSDAPRHLEPQEAAQAILEPDCYAWRLFLALNWPANVPDKEPDPNRAFGETHPVVWETWRNARNTAPDTVFPTDGSDPGPWIDGTVAVLASNRMDFADDEPLQIKLLRGLHAPAPAFDPATAGTTRNETRMNRPTYEFVRRLELYNLEGQIALFSKGMEKLDFPLEAKEIKAQWRVIGPQDKQRYHWTESGEGDQRRIFGLTSLHTTTKDLPNWFWATFEHKDNRTPESEGGRPGNVGWDLPSLDRFACPTPPHDCEAAPRGIYLEGTHWENYVLRGTQTDFVDSRSKALLLANSQPEARFQKRSSCMTCHALASVNGAGQRLSFNPPPTGAPSGFFNPESGAPQFTQLDFVWSLFRARRAR